MQNITLINMKLDLYHNANNMNIKGVLRKNEFFKMHGTGNNFIIIGHHSQSEYQLVKLALKLCNTNFGIGADGLLIIHALSYGQKQQHNYSSNAECPKFKMTILNRDGSNGGMCGNGLRCLAACLAYLGIPQPLFLVATDTGDKTVSVSTLTPNSYSVKIKMGSYEIVNQISNMKDHFLNIISDLQCINVSYMVFNIPHYVIQVKRMPPADKIIQYGKQIQRHLYSNINFIQIEQNNIQEQKNMRPHLEKDMQNIQVYIRTFERGAGLTLSCGTGACSSFLACIHNKILSGTKKLRVRTQGGILTISRQNDDVYMDGPAQIICKGTYI